VKTRKPPTYLLTDFVPMLTARGVTPEEIEIILRDNPRRLLTGVA
jgi:predicted metal-dependent phosphotriesterase family hydrolase